MHEAAVVGYSSVFLLFIFFMARVYFALILRLLVTVLIKDEKNSHLKKAVEMRPEMSFVSSIGYVAMQCKSQIIYWNARVNKNPSARNFLSPKPEVTCGRVAIIIRVVLLSPYLRISAVSLSSIHYNQSHSVYINRRRQYICLI